MDIKAKFEGHVELPANLSTGDKVHNKSTGGWKNTEDREAQREENKVAGIG